jgi:histidyl-tRNA synthetase
MKTIDLTPKWVDVFRVLSHVAENGESAEGRTTAINELRRMAKLADNVKPLRAALESIRGHLSDQCAADIEKIMRYCDEGLKGGAA